VLTLPFLLAAALGAPGTSRAEALTLHLRRAPLVHGTFRQTRHLAVLSRPLVATGDLVVDRDRGVLWQVKKPLVRTFVLGPGGLREADAAGKAIRQPSQEAPVMAQMARIVGSLLKGQWSTLDDFFTVHPQGDPSRWEIVLEPRPSTAPFLKRVRVSGAAFLERIQVEEPGGDTMDVTFQNPRADLPLTGEEARLFALP
jgi:hypothetical protein